MIQVPDPAAAVAGPYLGNIVFGTRNGGGGGGAGSGVAGSLASDPGAAALLTNRVTGSMTLSISWQPDVLPHPLLPLVNPVAQQFVRKPPALGSGASDEGDGATGPTPAQMSEAASKQAASRIAVRRAPLETVHGLSPVRGQANILDTTPAGLDITVEPARSEIDAVPTPHTAAAGEESLRADMLVNSLRITGVVASLGAVGRIARAMGLVAKLVTLSSAARRLSPLPVLRREKKRQEKSRAAATAVDEKQRRTAASAAPRRLPREKKRRTVAQSARKGVQAVSADHPEAGARGAKVHSSAAPADGLLPPARRSGVRSGATAPVPTRRSPPSRALLGISSRRGTSVQVSDESARQGPPRQSHRDCVICPGHRFFLI